MSRFILQSACRGRRPRGVGPQRLVSRSALVSRLLADRRAARVLCAPDGFGKTALACEYAEVMFGFQHVYWINGLSPCFLRDLDAGIVAEVLCRERSQCDLVVFDDVPGLDEERAAAFGAVVAALLAAGMEVLAITTPGREEGIALACPTERLDGRDLLVSAEEARGGEGASPAARGPLPLEARVPCLRWGEEGVARLLAGIAREALPPDLRLVQWTLLALGRGRRGAVEALLGPARGEEAWAWLAERYPFLGLDDGEGAFETVPVAVDDLRAGLGAEGPAGARAVGIGDGDTLVLALATWLIGQDRFERGAALAAAFASTAALALWLPRAGGALLWHDAAETLGGLRDRVARRGLGDHPAVSLLMAAASAQRGDGPAAVALAQRALAAAARTSRTEAAAALTAYRWGASTLRAATLPLLVGWRDGAMRADDAARGERACGSEAAPIADSAASASDERAVLDLLVAVTLAEARPQEALAIWAAACLGAGAVTWDRGPRAQGLLLAAAWVVDALAATGAFEARREDWDLLGGDDFALLATVATTALEAMAATGNGVGYGGRRVAEALQRIEGALALAGLRACPSAVDRQRDRPLDAVAPSRPAASHPDAARGLAVPLASADLADLAAGTAHRVAGAAVPLRAPRLHVRLFGTMVVHIGETEISSQLLSRKKARLLLALLVLHRDRELTRDGLVAMLWPQADPRTGTKSFYRLWGELAAILSVDGECPYLVRDHQRCHLNAALCTSDVMEFEELIRALLFGLAGGSTGWEEMLRQVQESFDGELLPAERRNETVVAFRRRYATELVDALVAASGRLRSFGELQGALWCAREALRRDRTREDGYAALMEAQLAVGQRAGALDTFLACRGYLADELGLDPSPQIMALHQRLIDGWGEFRGKGELLRG